MQLDEQATYQLIFEPGFFNSRGDQQSVRARSAWMLCAGMWKLCAGVSNWSRLFIRDAVSHPPASDVGHHRRIFGQCRGYASGDHIGHGDRVSGDHPDGTRCIPPVVYDYRELRGKPLPLIHLRHHFAIDGAHAKQPNIVVVSHGKLNGYLGLVVDQLLGEQQIVIKPLGMLFSSSGTLIGSGILGSGQVALILDIPGMLQRVHRQSGAKPYAHLVSQNHRSRENTMSSLNP